MEILKKLRMKKGVSQQDVADYLEITRQAYSNYENGRREADFETLLKIGEYFEVSVDYLLRGDSAPGPAGVMIPVLGDVAAGIPIEAVENIIDYEEISREMASSGEYFGLRIKGSSMEPRMCEGDVVIVKKQASVDSGDIAVVLVNGDSATVKKVRIGDDGITLISFNPVYEPMFFTKKQCEQLPVRFIGVVVELRAKF